MRLAITVLLLAVAGCDALYGELAVDNPANCTHNDTLCAAPMQACNPVTKLCEPAIILSAVSPARVSNAGGAVLTLTGQNLSADLTVLFNGVAGSMVTALPESGGNDQITVVAPPNPGVKGLCTIELVHPQGQTQTRSDLFGYYGPIEFQEHLSPGFNSPENALGGDFDGDGKADLVVCDSSTLQLYFVHGNGDGTLAQAVGTALAEQPDYCTAGDINGDGNLDVVVNEGTALQFEIFLGDGHGGFSAQPAVSTQVPLVTPTLQDISGDGKPDLISTNTRAVAVRLNTGNGTFAAEQDYTLSNGPYRFSLAFAEV